MKKQIVILLNTISATDNIKASGGMYMSTSGAALNTCASWGFVRHIKRMWFGIMTKAKISTKFFSDK